MDLRSLNIFIQVAELSSFTRAGEKLGYSQPTVSFQIRQLEQELGVQLFDRIGHTVSLTDEGRDALAYAQRICNLTQEMALGAGGRLEPSGLVRLALADSLCLPMIASRFAEFHEKYPKVSLQVLTGGTGDLFRLLDHNEADVVCTLDSPIYDTSYVIASEEKIGVHFVASPDNPLAKEKLVTIDQLLDQAFLLTEKGMSYRRLLDEKLAQDQLEIQPVLEGGRADLLCGMAAQNLGIAFLPDYVTASAVAEKKVVRLPVEGFEIQVSKQLIYRRDKWISQQMKAIIGHLEKILLGDVIR